MRQLDAFEEQRYGERVAEAVRMPAHNRGVSTREERPEHAIPALDSGLALALSFFTTYDGDEGIYRALRAGAQGYLLKGMRREQLVEAITAVHAGNATFRLLWSSVSLSACLGPPCLRARLR